MRLFPHVLPNYHDQPQVQYEPIHNQCMEVKSIQGLMEGLSLVIDGNRGTGKAVTLEMTKIYSNGEEDKIGVLWTYFCNRFSMG